jgi:hypothetical protein
MMKSLKGMSDHKLINQLKKLVSQEQDLALKILPHLIEVERRKLYLDKAYSTLTEYCIHELGYGDSSASRRVRVARVIQKIPEVYDYLVKNQLTFSAVLQVYRVLTPDNKDGLLPRLVGKTYNEIERIMAEYMPARKIFDQAKPTLVKKFVAVESAPARATLTSAGGAPVPNMGEMPRHSDGANDPADKISTPEVKEVLERMFEIRFAVDEELMELIQWMKSHLSHKFPKGAGYLEIFKRAIKYYKQREDLAENKPAHSRKANTASRCIPKAIKQKVWKRDNGRCSFVGSNGKRCNSDYLVQFDHYPIPFARGGPSTAKNLRLLCAKHNRYTARRVYEEPCIKKHFLKEAFVVYMTSSRGRVGCERSGVGSRNRILIH